MKKTEIRTNKAPLPAGPYSQAVRNGDLLFVSGTLPIDPSNNTISQDIAKATLLIFNHIDNILAEAGTDKSKILKTTIFMKDLSNFAEVNKLYANYFEGTSIMPARSTIQVAKLPLDAPVEIELIATF